MIRIALKSCNSHWVATIVPYNRGVPQRMGSDYVGNPLDGACSYCKLKH